MVLNMKDGSSVTDRQRPWKTLKDFSTMSFLLTSDRGHNASSIPIQQTNSIGNVVYCPTMIFVHKQINFLDRFSRSSSIFEMPLPIKPLHMTHYLITVNLSKRVQYLCRRFLKLHEIFSLSLCSSFLSLTKLQRITTTCTWSQNHKLHNLWSKRSNITWHAASWRSLIAFTAHILLVGSSRNFLYY